MQTSDEQIQIIETLRDSATRAERQHNFADAAQHLKAILEIKPDDRKALLRLSVVLGLQDEFDEQDEVIEKLLRFTQADDPDVLGVLAIRERRRKRWTQARDYFTRALELAPKAAWLRTSLIEICVALQDLDTLETALKNSIGFEHDISNYRALQLGPFVQFVDLAQCSNTVLRALLTGSYEKEERELANATFATGDRVIEIGCGIGAVTTCIGAKVGADGVLAIDANEAVLPVAQATTAANGLNVRYLNVLLDSGFEAADMPSGSAKFNISSDFWASSVLDIGQTIAEVEVPRTSFDRTVADFEANALCMDIEGAEVELLMAADLSPIRKIVIELHPQVVGDVACSMLFEKLIATGFIIDFALSRPQLGVYVFMRSSGQGEKKRGSVLA